jgi:hypothetical protein
MRCHKIDANHFLLIFNIIIIFKLYAGRELYILKTLNYSSIFLLLIIPSDCLTLSFPLSEFLILFVI